MNQNDGGASDELEEQTAHHGHANYDSNIPYIASEDVMDEGEYDLLGLVRPRQGFSPKGPQGPTDPVVQARHLSSNSDSLHPLSSLSCVSTLFVFYVTAHKWLCQGLSSPWLEQHGEEVQRRVRPAPFTGKEEFGAQYIMLSRTVSSHVPHGLRFLLRVRVLHRRRHF